MREPAGEPTHAVRRRRPAGTATAHVTSSVRSPGRRYAPVTAATRNQAPDNGTAFRRNSDTATPSS